MNARVNPDGIMPPFNNAYSHGIVIPPNARVLHTAGQIGARPDGSVPTQIEAQAEQLWMNLRAILDGAGMRVEDIVKLTAYIVGEENYAAYAAARGRHLGDHKPASTAVCVPRLLKPEWLLEVELVAARTA
jgi:2-iminobutanoate/2-iminopropanoate deaminase